MNTNPNDLLRTTELNQRKVFLKRILLVGASTVGVILVLFLIAEFNAKTIFYLIGLLAILLSAGISGLLLRANKFEQATHVILLALFILIVVTLFPGGLRSRAIMALLFPLLMASLLLSQRWTHIYTLLTIGAYIAIGLNPVVEQTPIVRVFSIVMGVGIIAFIGLIASSSASRLQFLLNLAGKQTSDLQQLQSQLEARVDERTATLQATLSELQTSSETIRQLSVPLMRIGEGVVLLPLLGTISPQRATEIEQFVLDQAYNLRPNTIIIDLTGLSGVTQQFTLWLGKFITALHLLGIQPILVGIHAEIALNILDYVQTLPNITIKRDVQQALNYVTT